MKRIKNGNFRVFSTALKKEKVKLIDEGKITVNQVRNIEQVLGRKQMELDYYKEIVKLIS